MNKPIILYSIWLIVVLILTFMTKGFNDPDSITHVCIIVFIIFQALIYPVLFVLTQLLSPKLRFIILSVFFACVVEGFYMISKPVSENLKVTFDMGFGQIARNYIIDLLFTVPVYVIIFLLVWYIINKYSYNLWEYVIFISLGQAIGDGISFFVASPKMMLFIPYVMLNYQAMNLIPYLLVRNEISSGSKNVMRYILPPAAIILVYLICGFVVQFVGKASGFF